MKTSQTLFTDEQIASIEGAIGQAEKNTSAELVPVVATSSGRYDRAEDVFAFLLSLFVFASVWIGFQGTIPSDNWVDGTSYILNLPTQLAILSVTFVVGIVLATYIPVVRLPFISTREMQEEVEQSARETFQKLRIRDTDNAAGVLIYVSLYEHMVHVVGDDSVNAKLSKSDWQDVCDTIITGFKNGDPEEGLRKGILSCGGRLAEHFPIQADDKNELNDKLYLF